MASKQRTPSAQAAPDHRLNRNGNHTLERERVTNIQRARMLTAMTEAACEHGAANVTVAQVVERAGVSRRTFYELFDDIEDCLLAAIDEAGARASDCVLDAYDREAGWAQRMRGSLLALLSFLEEEPFIGRLLIVESLGAGPQALRRRQAIVERVSAAVDDGRTEAGRDVQPPPLTAEGVVGGVLGVLHARLSQSGSTGLLELANPLMSMIVLPYRGAAAARREVARALPAAPARRPSASAARLSRLHMRLTYRTIRVLTALAAHPGSSNRQVASAAGVSDQGQMSKLLARLRALGLIENTSVGSVARGEPNAWMLTSDGWEVQSALAQQHFAPL